MFSSGSTPSAPPPLSPELWDIICSHLSKSHLVRMRLASRRFNSYAQRWTFWSLRLEGYGGSADRLMHIAMSPKLRELVRELTIDTWLGPGRRPRLFVPHDIPADFMDALPLIRHFRNVSAIHVRFNCCCGDPEGPSSEGLFEEAWNFRYSVLDTICHCIAGLYTRERQEIINRTANLVGYYPDYYDYYACDDLVEPGDQPLRLREFTVYNLADYEDRNLQASEAWQKVLALPSLIDLKLLVTAMDESELENEGRFPKKYDLFRNLPYTWLRPDMAENLTVFSLFYREFWGWVPKMDFRAVSKGASPFPRLRTLALGHYVFYHDWQIDWFASVGSENGVGGLENLYLDACPVLYEANLARGVFDNEGEYPDPEKIHKHGQPASDVQGTIWKPKLRWYTILSRWAESMTGLRVFRMGKGDWCNESNQVMEANFDDEMSQHVHWEVLRSRSYPGCHRSFRRAERLPQPGEGDDMLSDYELSRYLHGAGPSGDCRDRMRYLRFWYNSFYRNGWRSPPPESIFVPEAKTKAMDEGAYELLMARVHSNRRR